MDCFIAVALKRRSPDQQHQCNLGRCWKYKFSGLTSETLGWGPAVGSYSLPGGSGAPSSLRNIPLLDHSYNLCELVMRKEGDGEELTAGITPKWDQIL